jgi:hypothetical protein
VFFVADYSESFGSSEEDETSPCDKVLTNRKGWCDFRIRSLKHANIGRKVIGIAEHGEQMDGRGLRAWCAGGLHGFVS